MKVVANSLAVDINRLAFLELGSLVELVHQMLALVSLDNLAAPASLDNPAAFVGLGILVGLTDLDNLQVFVVLELI
jgi:hypothetical protein